MIVDLLILSLTAILAENFVLVKFMGCCPFLGVSRKTDTAFGMGMAVTFVMGIASAITWTVDTYILKTMNLEYMQTIVFILIIAALVQFVELFLQKTLPALYQALGIYLPLITTNCAVLGVAILNVQNEFNFIETVIYGISAALGFTLAILLLAGVREKTENNDIPYFLKGFPITLITAGLMAIAFLGFSGMKF